MKNIIFLFFLIFISLSGYCQKNTIKLAEANTYSKERLTNEFINKNSMLFDFSYSSSTILSFEIDISKIFKIEGVSTKYAGKGKIILTINNDDIGIDTSFLYVSNLSVENKYEVENKLIDAFLNQPDGLKTLAKNINNYLIIQTSKNCSEVINAANKELNNKNWKEAFRKAKSVINSNCKVDAQNIVNQVDEAYGEEFCNEKLSRIKVLAASGIEYKMEMAVDELYLMPPKAKCKEEAITISKQIGEYFMKKNNGSTKIINLNQIVTKGNSLDVIFRE